MINAQLDDGKMSESFVKLSQKLELINSNAFLGTLLPSQKFNYLKL